MMLKTISPLIVVDPMRKNSQPVKIVIVEDHTVTDENDFYQSLHRHSILHRLVLARPFSPTLTLDKWHRIDLEVVNELGLSLKGNKDAKCCMSLSCHLFVVDGTHGGLTKAPTALKLEYRPLQVDNWDNSVPADLPGFHSSGTGGIEVKVTTSQSLGSLQYTTKAKYFVRVAPVCDAYKTLDALPLTLGPMDIQQQRIESITWSNDRLSSVATFRQYALDSLAPQLLQGRFFVVKEGWKMGTPGKIWDSALVMSDMFAKRIMQERDCLKGRHVVDLSAGTGCIGLLLALLLRRLITNHTCHVTLTDVPEALDLIHENQILNLGTSSDPNVHIDKLRWGSGHDAKHILKRGYPDIILASDVLYDPTCFSMLVDTLKTLSAPQQTVIYLGYKRRGLKREDESAFFNMAKRHFHITTIDEHQDITYSNPVDWEVQNGYMRRNHMAMDGKGWLGPAGTGADIFGESRQEGKVIIYRLVRKTAHSVRAVP
ncbi:putative methyltransferase-domain-containing protein [Fennellomyces sp. T-0311]|nr:putative methyltransferase-domain-containing protein [Fennellomyces sp. T-0311]